MFISSPVFFMLIGASFAMLCMELIRKQKKFEYLMTFLMIFILCLFTLKNKINIEQLKKEKVSIEQIDKSGHVVKKILKNESEE